MFLGKVQWYYWHIQMFIYRKIFVFKPISNQLNILVALSFTKSLNTSYSKVDQ